MLKYWIGASAVTAYSTGSLPSTSVSTYPAGTPSDSASPNSAADVGGMMSSSAV